MTPKTCPDCGGPLQPPDDFCQQCMDNEMKARSRAAQGFPEGTPWYRQSLPFLAAAVVGLLLQVGAYELIARPAGARKRARLKKDIRKHEKARAVCERETTPTEDDLAAWDAVQCMDYAAFERNRKREQHLEAIQDDPGAFYLYVAVMGVPLLLLTLWSRTRPMAPSLIAVVVMFFGILIFGPSDSPRPGWSALYVLMGLIFVATLVAAYNGAKHTRD